MRIGIDARSLQEEYPSGVSAYTRELIRALLQLPDIQHHTLVLFCNATAARHEPQWLKKMQQLVQEAQGGPSTAADGAGNDQKESAQRTVKVEWRIRTWPNKLVTLGHLLLSLPSDRWMFGDVDVVLIDSIHFYPFRRHRIPYVVVVHDLSFERFPDCLSFKGRLWHRLLQPRQLMQRAAHCVAVSHNTAEDLASLYRIPTERVSVVYPGLPPVNAGATAGQASGTIGTTEESTQPHLQKRTASLPQQYMLWCSTVEPRKNIETVFLAMEQVQQQHPGIALVVAGAVTPKQRAVVQQYASRVRMTLMGYVDDATKQELLRGATAMVYPSLYEGFGFPPLEAQQHGVPVIVGTHSSLPEVCGEGALYVDVHNVDALARAIHHVLTDDVLRRTLVERGYENIKRFSWQHTAEQVVRILEAQRGNN